MINKGARSPQHHRHLSESYDDKRDRRLVTHEILRSRVNVTSCRHVGKSVNKDHTSQAGSPRQKEFFKRRNLSTDDEGRKIRFLGRTLNPPSHEDILRDTAERRFHGPTVVKKLSWDSSKPLFCYPHALRTLNNISRSFNVHSSGTSNMELVAKGGLKRDRGTQTLNESSLSGIRVMRNSSQQTDSGTAVLDKEIFQLSEYLKEALHRERKLKQKLVVLQELLAVLVQAAEKSWKVQVSEDKLKSRVGALERQLRASSQSSGKAGAKKLLREMEDQKQEYEQKAKDSLQKILEEKGSTEQELQNAQRTLAVTEGECSLWKKEYEIFKKAWSDLIARHTELQNELYILQSKLECVDTQDIQLQKLQACLHNLEREQTDLQTRLDTSQEDNELQKEQLCSMKDKWRIAEKQKLALELTINQLKNEIFTMRNQLPLQKDEVDEKHRAELQKVTSQLALKEKECTELHSELEALSDEYFSCQTKLRQCRDQLKSHQGRRTNRRSCWCCWVPFLVVAIATALAAFLTNLDTMVHGGPKKFTPF
ncbi:TRAF3-interacting JNK-activating modulator [Microcaecilia unicolor]|uniref:TRAF3-interacting JNK-activating modulator n=1 Tax=Microcaecilia unicolor TaxID=1415580 RepID=A0A6P7ZVW6_9AMPH|nr:TRAF3-interacting JNK-activating modulator [Microcaecilia unicolor]XP_030077439.1 TRAF3-interacting JNK-activating modulator [Microcaecilia unicolor]XP_030077440.1 TRAF3-interacting JNK-activating modulator [Microcaecilia unicolor]